MNTPVKTSRRISHIGLTIVVMIGLILFCYVSRFPLIIPLLLFFGGLHLYYHKKTGIRLFLNLGLLLALIVTTASTFLQYHSLSTVYIPVASVAMLTVLLFNDLQIAFMMSLLASVVVGLVVHWDFHLILTFFVGSLGGLYSLKEARKRQDLIKAGVYVGLVQALCMILLSASRDVVTSKLFIHQYLYPLFVNGFISFMVVTGTSRIFEWLFGVLTNFSLLEMADTNHPLLKRMALEAPGTYHHSLVVSNLAESAADTIGANPLLTRVGAYFHDIGKLVKPEYFVENQLSGANKHENLEPSMSRLIILNHVKEGIELAQKYKLHPLIIDFIPQHHGTGLIFYFYQRALEGAEDENISEENFRYPGPKPQSRETAVVLLADSVEGATRSIDEPTPSKVDEVVRKIINNRFIDGQLDECNLTLKDLEMISRTFSRVLSAMHHGRVKYPEKKNGHEYNSRKSAETHFSQSPTNHQDRKKNSAS